MFLTLQHFQRDLQGLHVQVRSDNTTTCAYINKMGGTRSKAMCWQTWDMLTWCISQQITLSAIHVPGVENVLADFLSRQEVDQREWSLHGKVTHLIFARWGTPCIDLFASVHNHKVGTYCSLLASPVALSRNAFLLDWGQFQLVYVFPPLAILHKVLHKIRQDKARAILIAPRWPRRGWYSQILGMLVRIPLRLPSLNNLLSQHGALHPDPDFLELVAWKLSGIDSEHRAFLRRLSAPYKGPEPDPWSLVTSPNGKPLTVGVLSGTSIPIIQM